MHTLEWLNRQSAFTTSARVPHRLLKQLSVHASNLVRPEPFLAVRPELVEGSPASTRPVLSASKGSARTDNNNLLIQGDNLEALKALPPFYCG